MPESAGQLIKAKSRPRNRDSDVRGFVCGFYSDNAWGDHNDTTVIAIVLFVLILHWAAPELTR
jgi:hypothetical protein